MSLRVKMQTIGENITIPTSKELISRINIEIHKKRTNIPALAGEAQVVEHRPMHPGLTGTCPGFELDPQ